MLHVPLVQLSKFGLVLLIQAPGSGQEKAKRQSIDLQLKRCRCTSVDTKTLKIHAKFKCFPKGESKSPQARHTVHPDIYPLTS